jgi:hypothetical protein
MRQFDKLLSHLSQSFSIDPEQFLAFRLRYAGEMSWTVLNGELTTSVVGGPGSNLTINLADYTINSLVDHLSAQPGYSVSAMSADHGKSALVILEGSADQDTSNGDHLYAFSSLLYALLQPFSFELTQAETQINEMLNQMVTTTAEGEWIDAWGSYLGVPRISGEIDADYRTRIVPEVIRPRENNVAIEMAIKEAFGQTATVTDVLLWSSGVNYYNSTYNHDSAITYGVQPAPIYCLFDVNVAYNLETGADMLAYAANVRAFIDRFRSAGTHMQALALGAGVMSDTAMPPSDDGASISLVTTLDMGGADVVTEASESMSVLNALLPLADTVDQPSDSIAISMDHFETYNGLYFYNGAINHTSGTSTTESF